MTGTQYEIYVSFRERDRPTDMPSRSLAYRLRNKRAAIRQARRMAQRKVRFVLPRQVSVYAVPPGKKRGTLIYQVHYSPKLGRLIAEEL